MAKANSGGGGGSRKSGGSRKKGGGRKSGGSRPRPTVPDRAPAGFVPDF